MPEPEFSTTLVGLHGEYSVDLRAPFQQGGQGELFHARDTAGTALVVKLYHRGRDTPAVRDGLVALTRDQPPGPDFLWPLDVTMWDERFGYVMPLAPPGFLPLRHVLSGEVQLTFGVAIEVALRIVDAFRVLHASGFHYCDISDGNVMLHPELGQVLICDNDNVGTAQRAATIRGTPGFMAPEVGKGAVAPSAGSDKFSLGVLLFLLLVGEHPLEGRRDAACVVRTPSNIRDLYIENPVFIFDPVDTSNRPAPGWQDNALVRWPLLPRSLRSVFTTLFTAGLHSPAHRPSFHEWNLALVRARDLLVDCASPDCGAEAFYLDAGQVKDGEPPVTCWACGSEHEPLPRLTLETEYGLNFDIALPLGRVIRRTHLLGRVDPVRDREVIGLVIESEKMPGIWGIRNESSTAWTMVWPTGETREIQPGRSAALRHGVQLELGTAHGLIEFDPEKSP